MIFSPYSCIVLALQGSPSASGLWGETVSPHWGETEIFWMGGDNFSEWGEMGGDTYFYDFYL